jgi:hypothetical protein
MRKLRILFIVAGLVGAFYLNGAGNSAQASPGAAALTCYHYKIPGYSGECAQAGDNCEDGSGIWCEYCAGYTHCIEWST